MSRESLDLLLRRFLRDELGVEDELAADTPLVTAGLIDSAGVVRLAALLEDATGIVIPDRDINADHFDSLVRITAYLAARGVGGED
jgi:acyl carrier protein